MSYLLTFDASTACTLARAAVIAVGALAICRPGFRRSLFTKAGLAAALLFAAIASSLPLLELALAATIGVIGIGLLRRRYQPLDRLLLRAAGELPEHYVSGPPAASWAWCIGGLAVLCVALGILEFRQPYYFCQDDMLVGESPGLLFGLRSVWHGVFPEWNPYQYMGSPYASAGGGRLFYPPTYLAYAFARHVMGNEAAAVDVSAILHVVAGYFAVYWAVRRLGSGAALAALAGLSVALSGSTLIMGRCWAMFIYGTVWAPLLLYSIARLARGPVGWRWVLLTGLGVGVLFQIGFVQLWVTVLMLMAAAALLFWVTGQMPADRLAWLAAAVLLGTALAAPLMYQQWLLTRDMMLEPRSDTGIFVGLPAMLLPYPLVHARHPLDWGGVDSQYMGGMYYFGTLFAFLLLLALAAVMTSRRNARHVCGANIWAVLALGVLVLALGRDAGAWQVMSALPVLSIVNHYPFRLLPFFTLLAVLGGAAVGERLLNGAGASFGGDRSVIGGRSALSAMGAMGKCTHLPVLSPISDQLHGQASTLAHGTRSRRGTHGTRSARASRTRWELAAALPTAGLLLWHVWFARSSFYQYGFCPTAALPAEMATMLNAGDQHPRARLMGWAPQRSSLPEFRLSMKLNLPMADCLLAFDGYDPLTAAKPAWRRAAAVMTEDPVVASRVYGLRWHVLSRLVRHPRFSADSKSEQYMESSVLLGDGLRKLTETPGALRVAARFPELTLADAGTVDPLAFPQGRPDQPLPVTIGAAGVDVDTTGVGPGENIVVNWLWYPPMRADTNGRPLACSADPWGRIVIAAPAGTEPAAIHVRYQPNWRVGVDIGLALANASVLMTVVLEWFRRSGGRRPGSGKSSFLRDTRRFRRCMKMVRDKHVSACHPESLIFSVMQGGHCPPRPGNRDGVAAGSARPTKNHRF